MNKLKFRAWYKEGNAMYYDCLPLGGWDHWWIAFNNDKKYDGEFEVGKDIEVMQFTGMKDKNGVEIYEFDYAEKNLLIYLVMWNKYKYVLKEISSGDIIELDNDIEVRSNVYENIYKFTAKYAILPQNS